MNEYEAYEVIKAQVCKDIVEMAEKIRKEGNWSIQEIQKMDILYHLKKDMLATHGMEHPEEYERYSGDNTSGRRGRAANGQYTSREMENSRTESYMDGYSQGYSEAMSRMNGDSGHSPTGWMPPYNPPRRW
jgi:hypothetical protein